LNPAAPIKSKDVRRTRPVAILVVCPGTNHGYISGQPPRYSKQILGIPIRRDNLGNL